MRKRRAEKRSVLPDPIYHSQLVTRAINKIMTNGKKGVAQKIMYNALSIVEKETKKNPLEVFNKAVENVQPHLQVKSRRVGGANYQVPIEVNENKKKTLALRWIINYAKLRSGKTMIEKLASEIMDASKSTGAAFKKKQDTHKMAEANKAFAHFRF